MIMTTHCTYITVTLADSSYILSSTTVIGFTAGAWRKWLIYILQYGTIDTSCNTRFELQVYVQKERLIKTLCSR